MDSEVELSFEKVVEWKKERERWIDDFETRELTPGAKWREARLIAKDLLQGKAHIILLLQNEDRILILAIFLAVSAFSYSSVGVECVLELDVEG